MQAFSDSPSPLGRFLRFGLVGASGVLVNLGFYALGHDLFGFHYQAARVLAIEASIISNFWLNDRWTFRDRTQSGWVAYLRRMFLFHLPSWLVAGFVQIWTHETLRRLFQVSADSQPRWRDMLAYLMAIALGALLNYFICNFLIFRHRKRAA